MTGTASLPGIHPKHTARHVSERLDDIADQGEALASQLDAGLLRFAKPAEREDCRDAVARLADVVLGLARKLEVAA